jgi:hypothetical protein
LVARKHATFQFYRFGCLIRFRDFLSVWGLSRVIAASPITPGIFSTKPLFLPGAVLYDLIKPF